MSAASKGCGHPSNNNEKQQQLHIFGARSRELVAYSYSQQNNQMEGATDNGVRILSRRMVRPSSTSPGKAATGHHQTPVEEIHLTPWDLRLITVDYVQKGVLLPQPPAGAGGAPLADALASSFARALGRFYPFAGRLATEERADGTVTVSLRCTGDGAEFVHAAAPGVSAADIAAAASFHVPSAVVSSFFRLNEVLGADAAAAVEEEAPALPVLAAQVTELADGVFVGVSLNHSVGDGTAFWHFFNTWSEIHRRGIGGIGEEELISAPAPAAPWRWFVESSPVPIPLPFRKLQHVVRRFDRPTVQECFFTFSAASVKRLKARANAEMASTATDTAGASTTISSLQAVLAHLWRAVCRARRLAPEQATSYTILVGCRGRVRGVPAAGYIGNAVMSAVAESTAGEVEANGLGGAAWLLNRAVASVDEARVRESLERWVGAPDFAYAGRLSSLGTALATGSSPRFDVFGNDFGWGNPVAVRSGPGNKLDGKATVFEGPEKGGSMSLEVCIAPDALARLLADAEFMDAVTKPAA